MRLLVASSHFTAIMRSAIPAGGGICPPIMSCQYYMYKHACVKSKNIFPHKVLISSFMKLLSNFEVTHSLCIAIITPRKKGELAYFESFFVLFTDGTPLPNGDCGREMENVTRSSLGHYAHLVGYHLKGFLVFRAFPKALAMLQSPSDNKCKNRKSISCSTPQKPHGPKALHKEVYMTPMGKQMILFRGIIEVHQPGGYRTTRSSGWVEALHV
jgi:hypothetical protein